MVSAAASALSLSALPGVDGLRKVMTPPSAPAGDSRLEITTVAFLPR